MTRAGKETAGSQSQLAVSSSPMDQPDPLNATIVEREMLTDSLGIFRIAYDDAEVPDFEPGQFTNLGLPAPPPPEATSPGVKPAGSGPPSATAVEADPKATRRRSRVKLVRRAYSIASPPTEKRWLEFYIVSVDEGALTPRVFDLDVGGRLFMDTKIKGHFTLKGVPEDKTLITVATGTGLAPFLSMYHRYRDDGRWRKFVFIHGVRYEKDLGYREQLEAIAREDDRVVYLPAVTRPETSWAGIHGRVTEVFADGRYEQLIGEPLSADNSHVLLCGNPAMIDQLEVELVDRFGYVVKTPRQKEGNLHFERYW